MTRQLLNGTVRPIALIFAGGEGKRLWPVSSSLEPKQLNPFFSKDTLAHEAYKRAKKIFPPEDIYIVTTRQLYQKVIDRLSLNPSQVIIQPKNNDTTAAVALCALVLATKYSNALAVVFYSDHVILDVPDFLDNIELALSLASVNQHIITIGTRPTSALTEFGYIKKGSSVPKTQNRISIIDSFHEKPTLETAESFIKDSSYLWNTGVYLWSPAVLLQKIKQVQPLLYEQLLSLRMSINTDKFTQEVEDWYQKIPSLAFEKSISEKLHDMYVFEGTYEWLDIGNWKTVYRMSKKNKQGNALLNDSHSHVSLIDSENCLVYGTSKNIGVIGVSELIIIETDTDLLICHQSKVAKVKEMVELLQ